MNAIRWVFFDIGSTLVDEEEAYNHRIRDMIRGTSITFEQFSEKRIQYAKAGYNGDQKAIEYQRHHDGAVGLKQGHIKSDSRSLDRAAEMPEPNR